MYSTCTDLPTTTLPLSGSFYRSSYLILVHTLSFFCCKASTAGHAQVRHGPQQASASAAAAAAQLGGQEDRIAQANRGAASLRAVQRRRGGAGVADDHEAAAAS